MRETNARDGNKGKRWKFCPFQLVANNSLYSEEIKFTPAVLDEPQHLDLVIWDCVSSERLVLAKNEHLSWRRGYPSDVFFLFFFLLRFCFNVWWGGRQPQNTNRTIFAQEQIPVIPKQRRRILKNISFDHQGLSVDPHCWGREDEFFPSKCRLILWSCSGFRSIFTRTGSNIIMRWSRVAPLGNMTLPPTSRRKHDFHIKKLVLRCGGKFTRVRLPFEFRKRWSPSQS